MSEKIDYVVMAFAYWGSFSLGRQIGNIIKWLWRRASRRCDKEPLLNRSEREIAERDQAEWARRWRSF